MKTKYDWSGVPKDTQRMVMHMGGVVNRLSILMMKVDGLE